MKANVYNNGGLHYAKKTKLYFIDTIVISIIGVNQTI